MLKKILKHTLRTLLVILLVLLLVPALLYVPAVQDLARRRAVAYASRTLGMEVSVERIRLAFPLRLTVDNTLLADRTDTLLRCGRLSLDAALWPLIRKEVVIRSFALERVAAHYKDTLAGMDLRLAAGELSLEAVRADLSANTAGISRLVLADADIRLNLTEAAPAETYAAEFHTSASCWVHVIAPDGQNLIAREMKPGETQSVALPAGTRVTVGNPPALILTLDGHPYDLGGVTQRGVARFVIH